MPKIINADKDLIVSITRQLLNQECYDEINCRGIAARAGIGVGTLYHFFQSKMEIIAYIMFEDWMKIVGTINVTTDFEEGLESIYQGIYNYSSKYYKFWHSTKDGSLEYLAHTEKHQVLVSQVKELIVRLLNYNSIPVKDEKLVVFVTEVIIHFASTLNEYANISKYLVELLRGEKNGQKF